MSLTKQETFDRTVRFIFKQGKSVDKSGNCRYRGPDGKKCAAGLWISDGLYTPELEGDTIAKPACYDALRQSGFPAREMSVLYALQRAHDGTYNGPNFRSDFLTECRSVAEKYGLSTAVIDELLPPPSPALSSTPSPAPTPTL